MTAAWPPCPACGEPDYTDGAPIPCCRCDLTDRLRSRLADPATPSVGEAVALANDYYRLEICGAGGGLHLVLDDGNVEDGYVDWCIAYCRDGWREGPVEADTAGALLGALVRRLSVDDRLAVHSRSG